MRIFNLWLLFLLIIFLSPKDILAKEDITSCNNRYVTFVNPVRGRRLWFDKSINPLKEQYSLSREFGVPVTWLLQYDVLTDQELIDEIKKFDSDQEMGIFLEISEDLAKQARVVYPHAVPWFSPRAVFLSGYSQSERRKIINRLFEESKLKFGYYPKSVGAWWIDSYSLNYMKEKYGIASAMIVADQKTTDHYGVWGQWWGVPYYPAKANPLTPASNLDNKLDVVMIQWAQRDPLQAFGEGPKFSNYSLQANDYLERGKDTLYFKKIVDNYLDCRNPVGQVTVGLETGIESVGHIKEYKNQLIALKKLDNLQFVTMSQFSKNFAKIYPDFPKDAEIGTEESLWEMTTVRRNNEKLGEEIRYNPEIAFSDYFIVDNGNFLDRRLPPENHQKSNRDFKTFLWVGMMLGAISIVKKKFKLWVLSMLFGLAAFGLVFRSYNQYGWMIYYGPFVSELELVQAGLILLSFLVFILISKLYRSIYLLPLVFGMDPVISVLRFSVISNKYYLGVATDALRFTGISISSSGINFLNIDLPSYQAAALLKFNFDKIWNNIFLSLIVYPLLHVFLGVTLIYILSKLPSRYRFLVTMILAVLFIWHITNIFNADPRQVSPILLQ